MYKNSGHLKDSIGTKSILERNAVGYKIMGSENKERIKRAIELHELNRKTVAKIKFFDEDIKQSLEMYLRGEFDVHRVIIYDTSVLFDMKTGQSLSTEDILRIERLTGYTFERTSGIDRYIFNKKDYKVDDYEGLSFWTDEIKKVSDYIRDGKYD